MWTEPVQIARLQWILDDIQAVSANGLAFTAWEKAMQGTREASTAGLTLVRHLGLS